MLVIISSNQSGDIYFCICLKIEQSKTILAVTGKKLCKVWLPANHALIYRPWVSARRCCSDEELYECLKTCSCSTHSWSCPCTAGMSTHLSGSQETGHGQNLGIILGLWCIPITISYQQNWEYGNKILMQNFEIKLGSEFGRTSWAKISWSNQFESWEDVDDSKYGAISGACYYFWTKHVDRPNNSP